MHNGLRRLRLMSPRHQELGFPSRSARRCIRLWLPRASVLLKTRAGIHNRYHSSSPMKIRAGSTNLPKSLKSKNILSIDGTAIELAETGIKSEPQPSDVITGLCTERQDP